MYNSREEKCKKNSSCRHWHSKNKPSFSSTLLDQIYRSMDHHDHHDDTKTSRPEPQLLDTSTDFFFFSSKSTVLVNSPACLSSQPITSTRRPPKPVRTTAPKCQDIDRDHDDYMIKFKSKVSAHFRKVMKQPISPGARLTSFINSLFHNKNGTKLRFINPINININVDDDDPEDFKASALRGFRDDKSTQKKDIVDIGDDLSDSSSDLFELDHLNVFGNDELPVYETTRLDTTKRATHVSR